MVKLLSFDIFEFINHDKVTFLSARASPILSHFLRQVKHMRFPSISRLERDPKNIFYYQRDVDNCMDQVLDFLFDRHEYTHTHTHTHTHGIFRSVILVSIFILRVYVTFSLFFKI